MAAALEARGYDVEPVFWTDRSVDWSTYGAAVIRSCWEYPTDLPRFRDLLAELERDDLSVCNPLEIVRWNLHKSYVLALAGSGVRVPSTTVIEQGSDASLAAVLEEQGLDDAVVKPAVGTSSTDVWRTGTADDGDQQERFAALLADGDVLVQAFVPEIAGGERSAVFFDGAYSHAWNSPLADGFSDFGDADPEYEPTPSVRAQAATVLERATECIGVDRVPYARVDYVTRDGELLLLELELIEPYLGLSRGENAVERFCDALEGCFGR